ncbi:MAG: GNAT family N-acetyltransferase [Candidatus Latescibacteria bacterium]|nr:GNAT family N-acetyltransferase [Candidatus Latescibacterota bacterium]
MNIRSVHPDDAAAIAALYNHFVLHTTVSFEEEPVATAQMAQRIEAYRSTHPWLVGEEDGLVGYAYASPYRPRPAYRFTAETTIYLHPEATGRGLGSRLYQALLDKLVQGGFQTVLGIIALPNPASVALHEKLGFVQVGQLAQVGHKFDRWIDTGYWHKSLQAPSDPTERVQ